MRKYAFNRFAMEQEEAVRKSINRGSLSDAQTDLLRAICDADDIFTSRQLKRLLSFAFRF